MTDGEKISKGEKSRIFLIETMVFLLVEAGCSEKVSIRDVAQKAGVTTSLLAYHFHNREGLLKAVVEYLRQYGDNTPIRSFLDLTREIPELKEAQALFITNLLSHFRNYFVMLPPEQMTRCNAYRILSKSQEIANIYEKGTFFYQREALAFHHIYKTITGIDDWEQAFCWFTTIFEPLANMISSQKHPDKLDETHVFSPEFNEQFLKFCNRQLLIGLGLRGTDREQPGMCRERIHGA